MIMYWLEHSTEFENSKEKQVWTNKIETIKQYASLLIKYNQTEENCFKHS